MPSGGKLRRLRRIVDASGRAVILPLDVIVPVGPSHGAHDTGMLIDMAAEAGVSAVILRWGEAKGHADRLDAALGLVVRLSGATGLSDSKQPQVVMNTVRASIGVGADAVCVDLELGDERETESLRMLAHVCEEAEAFGVAVLAEVHVPDGGGPGARDQAQALAWGARTAREVGADLVKVTYPGSGDGMTTICQLAGIPVVVAGGARRDPRDALRIADEALRGGASGTAFARNVIEHEAPYAMQRALSELVRDRKPLDEVYEALETRAAEAGDGGVAREIELQGSPTNGGRRDAGVRS